jgi:uncharacterized membrane protein
LNLLLFLKQIIEIMSDNIDEDFSIVESAQEVLSERTIEDQISNNYYM